MRMFLANIRRGRPKPAGNGARKRTGRRISQSIAYVGNRKVALHQKLEAGIFAYGVLYLVEIGAKFGKPPLKTPFGKIEVGAISPSESSASDSRICIYRFT